MTWEHPPGRAVRQQVAEDVAAKLQNAGMVELKGRTVRRYFRSTHYEGTMQNSLKRRVEHALGSEVVVDAARNKKGELVALIIRRTSIA